MESLKEVEHNSLLRGVGPRQASVKANAAARTRVAQTSRSHRARRTAPLLAPIGGGRSSVSLLAEAAAAPVPVPPALTARQPWNDSNEDGSAQGSSHTHAPLSLSHQAHFIAAIWRETRNLTRAQQEAASSANLAQHLRQKMGGGDEKEEKKSASLRPTYPSASPVLPSLPLAPETLTAVDSLLNPSSIVHVAAALSVEAMQREEVARAAGRASARNASLKALQAAQAVAQRNAALALEGRPQNAAKQANAHAAHAAAHAGPSLISPRVRMSHRALHQSSTTQSLATRFAASNASLAAAAAASAHLGPSPPRSPSPRHEYQSSVGHGAGSATAYLHHVVSVYNAWQQQLAFMAQDLFAAKCADLGLAPTFERRDRFIARVLDAGAKDGVLRLQAQGLGRQSARAIVGFLRRVQAFAAPTEQERLDRATRWNGGARQRARRGTTGGGGGGEDESAVPSRDASDSDSSGSDLGSPGEGGERRDEDRERRRRRRRSQVSDDPEDGLDDEFLKRSFESSQSPTNDATSATTSNNTVGGSAFTFAPVDLDDPAIAEAHGPPSPAREIREGASVSQFISDLHSGGGELPSVSEHATSAVAAADPAPFDSAGASLRARKLLGFQRKYFHALDLTGNSLGDDGALELAALFLPNPQQVAADLEAASLATGSKTERRRARREKRRAKERARALGMDLPAGEDENDTLYPLSGLKTLVLRSNQLTAQGFAILFDSMAHPHAPLMSLDLSANSAVSSNQVLPGNGGGGAGHSIGLGNMFIGVEGCHSFGSLLTRNRNLRVVALQNVGMGTVPRGLEFLAAGLRVNQTLQTLDLASNRITGLIVGPTATNDGLAMMMHALRSSAVTDLNLSHNPLGSVGASHVATYIAASSTLMRLRLESCDIGVGGLALLTHALESSANLSDLVLDGNELHSSHLAAENRVGPLSRTLLQAQLAGLCIAPTLADNLSLHTMQLNNANIDDRTAAELARALQRQCTLHTLHLRSNRIGDDGGAALGQLLRVNHVLNQLDLCMNFIGDAGAIEIAKACALGGPVHHINMQNNKLGNVSGEYFLSALFQNPQLAVLLLDGNNIEWRWYQRLQEATARNKKNFDRTILPKQYALIRTLLREKAKYVDVLSSRDTSALIDRRTQTYLAELSAGLKSHRSVESASTDALTSELSRHKLDHLDLQSQQRAVNQALTTESNKREGRLHELNAALHSERNQSLMLKKKLRKGNENAAASAVGDKKPPPAPVDVESSNLDTILRLERKKLDGLRTDLSRACEEVSALIADMEKSMDASAATSSPARKRLNRRGSVSGATAAAAAAINTNTATTTGRRASLGKA